VTPVQALWVLVLEVPLYALNQGLVFQRLGAQDKGGSMSIHAFGAF
jgi:hypothetical protein